MASLTENTNLKVCCRCRVKFSAARLDYYCALCRAFKNQDRPRLLAERAREHKRRFPGVDIDRIHYKLGAVKKIKEAA